MIINNIKKTILILIILFVYLWLQIPIECQENKEEMIRTAINLMENIIYTQDMEKFLNFLKENNQNSNDFYINFSENDQIEWIYLIEWIYRDIFLEFIYNISHTKYDIMARKAQIYIINSNEEELKRIINYFYIKP